MSAQWTFVLADATGSALAELSTASGRQLTGKRNSYWETQFTISHEDDAAALLLNALANTGVPRLFGYRRGANDPLSAAAPLRFRGPLTALDEVSEETSLLTATFRSPFSVLAGDGDKTGRFLTTAQTYTATDAGLIGKNLIDIANADSPSGLATDPSLIVATKSRDRTYPVAQNVGTAVSDLTAVLDGCDFFESFVQAGVTAQPLAVGAPGNLTAALVLGGPAWTGSTGFYHYMVTANTAGGETAPSNEAALNYVALGPQIRLVWNPIAGAISYNVYRSLVSGGEAASPSLLASAVGATTYIDTGSATVSGAVPALVSAAWYPDAYFNVVASQGSVNPSARFEYGPQTLANVQSLERTTVPPTNCILVTGGNGLSSVYSDAGSVAKYGKWWGHADFSDVTEQATLDDKAKALCRPNPVKTVSFVPELALSPQPFDDWTLGDTVPFYASRGALQENAQLRINGFTVPIDENGFETVEVDDPTTPEEDAVTRASLIAEVVPS